jgi:sialidase-1
VAACGNATPPTTESLTDVGPRDASYDGALSFDGVDDYASLGTARAPHLKRDPQTTMLWFRAEGARTGGDSLQILFTLHRAENSGFALALDEDVPLAYKVYGDRELARATTAVSLREWHHLAFVIQGEDRRLYLDGAEVGASMNELTNRTPTQGFLGSADGFEHPYHGALDEVRVYARAFTAEEVASVAAGEVPTDAEPIVLYLPFDEAEGARAYDRSGLGNHAELGDGVWELMPARIRR